MCCCCGGCCCCRCHSRRPVGVPQKAAANVSQLTLTNGAVCWTSSLRFRGIKVFTVWILHIQTHLAAQPQRRRHTPTHAHAHTRTCLHRDGDDPQKETQTTSDMRGKYLFQTVKSISISFFSSLLFFFDKLFPLWEMCNSPNWSSNIDAINIWERVVLAERMPVCGRVGELGHKCVFIAVCSLFLTSQRLSFFGDHCRPVGCLRSGCLFTGSWKLQIR